MRVYTVVICSFSSPSFLSIPVVVIPCFYPNKRELTRTTNTYNNYSYFTFILKTQEKFFALQNVISI